MNSNLKIGLVVGFALLVLITGISIFKAIVSNTEYKKTANVLLETYESQIELEQYRLENINERMDSGMYKGSLTKAKLNTYIGELDSLVNSIKNLKDNPKQERAINLRKTINRISSEVFHASKDEISFLLEEKELLQTKNDELSNLITEYLQKINQLKLDLQTSENKNVKLSIQVQELSGNLAISETMQEQLKNRIKQLKLDIAKKTSEIDGRNISEAEKERLIKELNEKKSAIKKLQLQYEQEQISREASEKQMLSYIDSLNSQINHLGGLFCTYMNRGKSSERVLNEFTGHTPNKVQNITVKFNIAKYSNKKVRIELYYQKQQNDELEKSIDAVPDASGSGSVVLYDEETDKYKLKIGNYYVKLFHGNSEIGEPYRFRITKPSLFN